ncbi:VWA3B protein, partial [Rhinopomastus cyanomelas]|nr:VWA3B protein [Rhinopomastus cyanomelas]
WLQQGSRGLFGNVVEDDVYILIDTSQSMKDKLPLVKEKIFQLIQEQLRYKRRFNFVKFSAQAVAWQEKLAEVNEENLQDAWLWVKGLEVGSSTNTLQALQIALADAGTQAVYLLTDGRPDQPPSKILAQVQLHRKIPIHTVSFNCDDTEANKFLCQLSTETEGRFHYYDVYLTDRDAAEFIASEDLRLLKREIEQGEKDLAKMKSVHAECLMMDYCTGENDPDKNLSHSVKSREESPEEGTSSERKSFSVKRSVKCTDTFKGKLTEQEALVGAEDNTSPAAFVTNGASFDAKVSACGRKVWNAVENIVARFLELPPHSYKLSYIHSMWQLQFKHLKCISILYYILQSLFCSSLDISSALWLKTHGLVARRLTIMDALAPTAVPYGNKYIPILDKHVFSKVFDEILPLAHVSNDKKRITRINPQAVNLDAYKEKVEQAIKSYERLNLLIWRALPQEEKDKFKEDGPVQYMQHKKALLEALENLGWPVSYEDVMLLEDEIRAALLYIQQASDLQEAVKKENKKSLASRTSHLKKSKKPQKGQGFLTHKSQKVIARSDATGFYYPGTVIKNINSTCVLVGFISEETQIVPVKFTIPVGGAVPCPRLQVGDYVFARTGEQTGNEYYVPAIVIATPKSVDMHGKLHTVLMFNNMTEHCIRSELIKISQMKYDFSCCYIR